LFSPSKTWVFHGTGHQLLALRVGTQHREELKFFATKVFVLFGLRFNEEWPSLNSSLDVLFFYILFY
jgi:hypothetical protein